MCWKNWITKLLAVLLIQLSLLTNVFAHELEDASVSPGRGGNFSLHSIDGLISLEQFRGKLVLMFFGYTSCPDICPTTLAALSNVFSKLDEHELGKITALFISLDPSRDTPELLHKYTGYFHPNIIGVTDRVDVLNQLTENYGVAYERKEKPGSPLGYVISHTLDVLVVNRQGQLLETRIQPAASSEDILAYLRKLLAADT